jgi:RNA-directed DNA polymerase
METEQPPPRFPKLKSGAAVAEFLGLSWEALRYCLFRSPKEQRYRVFKIPKRSGGFRDIEAPCDQLKSIQGALLRVLEQIYFPRPPVHGFTFKRSIVTNARRHVGARWLLNVDLKDFFPTIHIGRVIGLFKAWPFLAEGQAATILAQICTHNGRLPQGAPTSPIISNMICFKMDRSLFELAKKHRCVYTRYADDISISTRQTEMPSTIVEQIGPPPVLGSELNRIVTEAKFEINPQKIRLQSRRQRMVVTGLKVNRFPNVRTALISQIRAMLHAWEKHGPERAQQEFTAKYSRRSKWALSREPSFRHVVLGKLLFLGQVRGFSDLRFTRFARQLYELDPTLLPKSPSYDTSHIARAASCVLTDHDESRTGTGFFAKGIGLVTCHHVAEWATRAFYPDSMAKVYEVKAVESDPNADLAICETGLPARYELTPNFSDLVNGTGVFLSGFPTYNPGFLGQFQEGKIVGRRQRFGFTRYIVSMRIVAGNSGGPLLDAYGRVVGVAATADVPQPKGYEPSDWGVVPIRYLKNFNLVREQERRSGSSGPP